MTNPKDLGWYVPDGARVLYDAEASVFSIGGAVVQPGQMLDYHKRRLIGWSSLENQQWFETQFGSIMLRQPAQSSSVAPWVIVAFLIAAAVAYFGWANLESERINAGIQQQKIDIKGRWPSAPTSPAKPASPFGKPFESDPFAP